MSYRVITPSGIAPQTAPAPAASLSTGRTGRQRCALFLPCHGIESADRAVQARCPHGSGRDGEIGPVEVQRADPRGCVRFRLNAYEGALVRIRVVGDSAHTNPVPDATT